MNLMLAARLKAAWHVRFGWTQLRGSKCRIWRYYSMFGFQTHAVFCECGKTFDADERGREILQQMRAAR